MTKRIDVLCPNCLKKKLLFVEATKETWCDGCGQDFIRTGENTVKYK
jgi:ribosomal protein S27E